MLLVVLSLNLFTLLVILSTHLFISFSSSSINLVTIAKYSKRGVHCISFIKLAKSIEPLFFALCHNVLLKIQSIACSFCDI